MSNMLQMNNSNYTALFFAPTYVGLIMAIMALFQYYSHVIGVAYYLVTLGTLCIFIKYVLFSMRNLGHKIKTLALIFIGILAQFAAISIIMAIISLINNGLADIR